METPAPRPLESSPRTNMGEKECLRLIVLLAVQTVVPNLYRRCRSGPTHASASPHLSRQCTDAVWPLTTHTLSTARSRSGRRADPDNPALRTLHCPQTR